MAIENPTTTLAAIDRETASRLNPLVDATCRDTLLNVAALLGDIGVNLVNAEMADGGEAPPSLWRTLAAARAALLYEAEGQRPAAS